jgi:uncharacterized protein YqeY
MASLEERIAQDMKSALKEGRKAELGTLRLLRSDLLLAAKNLGHSLEEGEVMAVLQKALRKRQESLEAYRQSDRTDLIRAEEEEVVIIKRYLPEPLSPEELQEVIEQVVEEVGAASPRDMGAVMKAIMPKVAGRADGRQVNSMVRETLLRRQ